MPRSQQRRTRIHVRRDLIARDRKLNQNSPAIGVETSGMRKRYGRSITITGPSKVVYRPSRPLSCGARAWMETYAKVIVHRQ